MRIPAKVQSRKNGSVRWQRMGLENAVHICLVSSETVLNATQDNGFIVLLKLTAVLRLDYQVKYSQLPKCHVVSVILTARRQLVKYNLQLLHCFSNILHSLFALRIAFHFLNLTLIGCR